jgi:salicylate hydroxylase
MKYLESNVVEPVTMAFRRWETGNVIGLTRLIPEFRNVFDAPYYVVHRADLQLAMYRMALESGVEVRLDCGIQTYDPDVPLITLESGETHTADLVVAADGL